MPSVSRPARQSNDPDKYIRCVKGRYQARPWMEAPDGGRGERYDLGLFATKHQARKAIFDFWWGKRESHPKFTKAVTLRDGTTRYLAIVVYGGQTETAGTYATREEAAAAAYGFCCGAFGPLAGPIIAKVRK